MDQEESQAFDILAAFDWSASAAKRWGCVARRDGAGWRVAAPGPARDVSAQLRGWAAKGRVLAGFDLPIGLPLAYARARGVRTFRDHLAAMPPDWGRVCATPDELSLDRPFYPARNAPRGVQTRAQLFAALGITRADLTRRCEHGAALMFWTCGPNQVGKAMLSAWHEVIAPLAPDAHLWPQDGDLAEVTRPLTLSEVYPARFYSLFGRVVKSTREGRAACASAILAHAERHGLTLDATGLREGYPQGQDDAFDALIGALGMIEVIEGRRPEHPGLTPEVRAIEGWMLGG